MPAEIFTALSNLRMILDTETDADSPNDETLNDAYRYAIECLLILMFGAGVSGTASSDPSNNSNGYFYDSAKTWLDDQHNGRTLVITSGAGKGNAYTIDDTIDSTNCLACTGDNLYADGVRSGDAYIILFDLKVNTDGHDHDGINSKIPVLGDSSIAKDKLKSATGSASGTLTASTGVLIGMQDYSFFPSIYAIPVTDPTACYVMSQQTYNDGAVGRFTLLNGAGGSANYVVGYRYLTSSDEPFIYIIRDKQTKEILHLWMADDPPPGYWGLDATPEGFVPPIQILDPDGKPALDRDKQEEIVCWKVEKELFKELMAETKKEPGSVCRTISEKWSFDGGKVSKKAK